MFCLTIVCHPCAGCDTENYRKVLKTAENLPKTKLQKTNPNPNPKSNSNPNSKSQPYIV